MAGVLAFTGTAVYAEEAVSTAAEPQALETYCPTNDDEEFPFNMDINVMPGSIQYIDLDEPIYGYESVLDEEALIFDINFSLKDEFKDFDRYEFQVFSSDYSEEIASEYLEKDEALTLSGRSIGTGYKIGMTLESESLTANYGGQFVIQAELNGSLSVDLFYQLAHIDNEEALYAFEFDENEPNNNSITTPDTLLSNRAMNGSTRYDDVDFFIYSSPNKVSDDDPDEDDRTGVANLEFTLNLTSAAEICMEFFDYNNKSVGKYETGAGVTVKTLFCRLANVPICASYKIKITSKSTASIKYTLMPSYKFALAWYGQFVSKDDNGVYWNANKLDKLSYGDKKIFLEKGDKYTSWFAEACGVVASAMALRNIGATINGYDFRTDYRGDLQADPFTVMLANCLEDGTKINSESELFINSSTNEPDFLVSDNVAKKFKMSKYGVPYYEIIFLNTLTGSTSYENTIRKALEDYKYVVIYFNYKSITQHFMLLTNLASGSGSFAERAIVCDPAARSYNKGIGSSGQGIKLSDTDWYKSQSSVWLSSIIAYY